MIPRTTSSSKLHGAPASLLRTSTYGSTATLEALLRERGAVHGMAMSTQLTGAQIADLTAFVETL